MFTRFQDYVVIVSIPVSIIITFINTIVIIVCIWLILLASLLLVHADSAICRRAESLLVQGSVYGVD